MKHEPIARLAGVELYFEDLAKAQEFYCGVLGLKVADEQTGHHVQLDAGAAFVCLERKGAEDYPSADKAVLFLEVADVSDAVHRIGVEHVVRQEAGWAVLHDPEGHNILLLQRG
ncbi:MAG: VOC family protein [Terriglobales bacterium]